MRPRRISEYEAEAIIEKRKPLGKFYLKSSVNSSIVYTGIDNSDGEAWTEDFKTKARCIGWLEGRAQRGD